MTPVALVSDVCVTICLKAHIDKPCWSPGQNRAIARAIDRADGLILEALLDIADTEFAGYQSGQCNIETSKNAVAARVEVLRRRTAEFALIVFDRCKPSRVGREGILGAAVHGINLSVARVLANDRSVCRAGHAEIV
jgi:hypothetical protein